MRLFELFLPEKFIDPHFKDFMMHMRKAFKIEANTPQEAAEKTIDFLLSGNMTSIRRMSLASVLSQIERIRIPCDIELRKKAELAIHESLKESIEAKSEMVNGIAFDNERGIGCVPFNIDISYFGKVVTMKPSTFLRLALPLERDSASSVEFLSQAIIDKKGIASPWFTISLSRDENGEPQAHGATIIGHEGRNRAYAIMETVGDVDIPVHLIFSGLRSHDISDELLDQLSHRIINERGSIVYGPLWTN